MKSNNTLTESPTISVHIPDYDTRFTYSLKMGDLCAFDDGNRLELADRAQLTDMVSIINAHLTNFNAMKREHAALVAVASAARDALSRLSTLGYGHIDLDQTLAQLSTIRGE